jgi:carbon-monoxide dehydrogenase large subunit
MTETSSEPGEVAGTKYFGRSVRRREDRRLLLGRGRFVADLRLPGQLEMMVVRSIHAHARIRSIDVSRAATLPGVVAVLTYADIAGQVRKMPAFDTLPDSKPAFQSVLADGKVRYVGEPVVVIVARDRYLAEDAADLVQIDYEVLPPLIEIEAALAEGAPLLYEEFGTNLVHQYRQQVGDPDAAFASAYRIYRERFYIHRYTAIPMETRGVLADADGIAGTATVWSSTQFPHLLRGRLAHILGLSESTLRIIAPDVGGGFGVKEAMYCEEVLAPLLSFRLGRPIRWIEDRSEHFVATTHGREQLHFVEAAVQQDGTITALRSKCYTSIGGAYASLSNAPGFYVSAIMRGPYRIPHYDSHVMSVVTNKTPLNVYRGAGHPQAVFCMERLMDRIARDLGMDRAELRLKNMLTPEELPSDRGTMLPSVRVIYDSGDYPRCFRSALEMLDYANFPAEQERLRAEGIYRGIGFSFFVEATALGPYETATVRVDTQGKITLLTGTSPHGQGTATSLAQLVAEELGIAIDLITVVHGDTGLIPDGIGTWGSRGGAVGGTAARLAAVKVKEKGTRLASYLLQVPEEKLTWTDGRIHLASDPAQGYSLGQLADCASARNKLPDGIDFNLDAYIHFQVPGVAYAYASHIAVVEVNTRTGRIRVRDYGVAHDCGKVINPMIVEGQIVGGVAQGIGATFMEDLVYDRDGQLLTRSMMEYLLPSVGDIPPIRLRHMETPTPHNPYGMKGAGEGGMTGAPAALVNAIEDALLPFGVKLSDDGPFTPSRIMEILSARPPTPEPSVPSSGE